MREFIFTNDYKADMHQYIDDLFAKEKSEGTDRESRLQASDDLIESYLEYSGQRPDSTALERLGSLILRDELADRDRMKVRNNEFPFHSDDQLRRRNDEEVSITWAEDVATDGRDYRIKSRDNNRRFREIIGAYK